ncbi:membrane dipeptidase [Sandaracinus amylolyticus]|nr:membrane dipeptidase [Sandaracinus amylolyticus]
MHWQIRDMLVVGLAAMAGCSSAPPEAPPLPPCTPTVTIDGAPALWGFADLHTHPGIEEAFEGQLVWGRAQSSARVSATSIPSLPPCPVETHVVRTGSPIERTAHSQILPLLNLQSDFPHPPIAGEGGPPIEGWPNGSDVLHQQMPVNAIRRAYEGGLRVLFASVTDSQVLTQLLAGPAFPEVIVPNRARERDSATRQLERIESIVDEQSDWMEIARSPEDARRIIGEGKLAVVLSLEMDALTIEDVDALIDRFGVAHVIPIHLIDNDHGGTAANGDIFNSATALMSTMFGRPALSFIEVEHTSRYTSRLGWPQLPGTMSPPLLFALGSVPLPWADALQYDNQCFCTGAGPSALGYRLLGHQNRMGLTEVGRTFVQQLFERRLIVDVSHMGVAATADAIALAEAAPGGPYPLIASHGGIAPDDGPTSSERDLAADQARWIAQAGGVVGLGSGGALAPETVLAVRGGPIATFTTSTRTACIADGDATCASGWTTVSGASADPITRVEVVVEGAVGGGSHVLEMQLAGATLDDAPVIVRAEMTCTSSSCSATLDPLPAVLEGDTITECADGSSTPTFTRAQIERVSIRLVGASCGALPADGTWAPTRATISIDGAPWAVAERENGGVLAQLGSARGGLDLFRSGDDTPSFDDTRKIVRIGVIASPGSSSLLGAALDRYGSELCARPRLRANDGTCAAPTTIPTSGCEGEWISMSFRGTWSAGNRFDRFVTLPDDVAPSALCGLDLALVTHDASASVSFSIDEARIEVVQDPIVAWAEDYAGLMDRIFEGRRGAIGFGTDMNGLAPQFPITRRSPSTFEYGAHGCSTPSIGPLTIDGGPRTVRLDERGLASYGQLADVIATIAQSDDLPEAQRTAVVDSLMLSAEGVLRVWERTDPARRGGTP